MTFMLVCRRTAVLIFLLCLPAMAAAQAQSVADIIAQTRMHGYDAPSTRIAALEAAKDRPSENASAEAKRQYFVALGQLAAAADNATAFTQAIDGLEQAGQSQACKPCKAQSMVLRASWDLTRKGAATTLTLLTRAEQAMGSDAPPDAWAHLYAARARNYRLAGHYAKSIQDALKALRIADQQKNAALQVEMTILLALDNASLGDFPRADTFIKEAISQATRIGFGFQLAYGYLNLGHIYALRNNREGQYEALTNALQRASAVPDLAEVRMIALSNIADYHLQRNEFETALDYAVQAGTLARSLDEQRSLAIALTNEGIALSHLGQLDKGIERVQQAIAIATKMQNSEHVIGMTKELIGIYERSGRYKEAVDALHRVAEMEKTLTAQERQRDVLALQEEFAVERKQQEIDRLSAINAQQKALAEARNAQRWMWLVVAVALAIAAFYLVRRLRGVRSANRRLSRANEVLEEQTARDPLTGTYNRRHFQNLLQQAAAGLPKHELRTPQPFLSLVVLDLDHFKQINDSFGHDAGDAVLIEVSRRMRDLVRTEDSVVRWGGEEFVLVLPGTGADGACTVVSKVLAAIGSTPVRYKSGFIPVTVSAGATTIPETGVRAWRFALQIADLALYRAKGGGRNHAVCVSEIDERALAETEEEIDLDQAQAQGHLRLRDVAGPGVGTS